MSELGSNSSVERPAASRKLKPTLGGVRTSTSPKSRSSTSCPITARWAWRAHERRGDLPRRTGHDQPALPHRGGDGAPQPWLRRCGAVRHPMSVADFRAALDEMAAAYTVSVGREETGVSLDVPAEDAWRALDLFAAVLQAPAFGVASAAAMGRRSQTEGIDWGSSIAGAIASFDSRLFRDHPFGRSPSADDTAAANADGAERYHQRQQLVPGTRRARSPGATRSAPPGDPRPGACWWSVPSGSCTRSVTRERARMSSSLPRERSRTAPGVWMKLSRMLDST